ncbi:MAG: galactose-1-phosphate uridylyltransferase [Clostridiales bacterium]|nr:galactose-1-phosphate uridylyltransferase [Clostridiales bacterium]
MARISYENQAKQNVKNLVDYAQNHLYLNDFDADYAQNALLDLLKLSEPSDAPLKNYEIYDVLEQLSDYAVRTKLIAENDRQLFETKLIGMVMPLPSHTVELFDDMAKYEGVKQACDMLFKLGEDSTYLRRPDLDKNIKWEKDSKQGKIIVTINLAKPEKTPEQVRLAKLVQGGYPKCMLCSENVGWAGNAAKPARQTLRTIPFQLDGEDWFMQFSPYQYFDQHVIAVCGEHRPMCVTDSTFRRMLDFLDLFPHYFIGSNAALPIVGGSILAHDHYQGGNKVLPLFDRQSRKHFKMSECPDVNVSIVDWYNSVVRIESTDREQALKAVARFRAAWDKYSDKSVNILCSTKNGKEEVQHNAITPIASINSNGEYQFDLILRNNRTDEAHPFGIFHPAVELHNIKQESIGIIEVMGLFILPGRLASEADAMRDILTGKTALDFKAIADEKHPLCKHLSMVMQLVNDNGTNCSEKKAGDAITEYINVACEKILRTTAVFKDDEQGTAAFDKFVESVIA